LLNEFIGRVGAERGIRIKRIGRITADRSVSGQRGPRNERDEGNCHGTLPTPFPGFVVVETVARAARRRHRSANSHPR